MKYSSFLKGIKSVMEVSSNEDIENRSISRANIHATLLLFAIMIFVNGIFFYYDAVYYIAPTLFSFLFVPLLVSSLFLNFNHRYYCTSLLLYVCYTLYLGGMGVLFFGKAPGFHYYNLVLALLPLISFKNYRWVTIYSLMIVNFSIFLYVEIYSQITTYTTLFPQELKEFKITHTFVIFIICAVILLFDRKVIENKTKKLVYLANKLEDKNRELEQSIITKDKFFSIIAHDLKGPIGNLSNFLEFLSDTASSFTEDELQNSLKALKISSNNTYSLLENLLSWSRIHTGDIVFDPHLSDLCTLVKSTIDLYSPIAKNKGITIDFEAHTPVRVNFDVNMINTVLRNLLNNAIKYSYQDGVVHVSCNKSDTKVTLSVTDNGIGLSPYAIKELFKLDVKHYSCKGTNGENGTGLGLIMCKEFIKRHGGDISVESVEGEGSTFSFTLPI